MRYSRTIDERRGIIGFVVPMNVGRALESGKVLVNTTFGKNGAESWVQFLDPEFAHKTYDLYEAEEILSSTSQQVLDDSDGVVGGRVPTADDGAKLTEETFVGRIASNSGRNKMKKVVFPVETAKTTSDTDSDSSSVSFRLTKEERVDKGVKTFIESLNSMKADMNKLSIVEDRDLTIPTTTLANQSKAIAVSQLEDGRRFAEQMVAEEAASRVKAGNLDRNRKQGVLNLFPTRSLVREDFKKRSLNDFQARVVCVANAVGGARMVSRISCDQRLKIPGCKDLAEWWHAANEEQRFLAVTEAKHIVDAVDKRRLLLLPCPFQDAGFD